MLYLVICNITKTPHKRALGQYYHGTLHDQNITCPYCNNTRLRIPDKPNNEGIYHVIGHTVRLVTHEELTDDVTA